MKLFELHIYSHILNLIKSINLSFLFYIIIEKLQKLVISLDNTIYSTLILLVQIIFSH